MIDFHQQEAIPIWSWHNMKILFTRVPTWDCVNKQTNSSQCLIDSFPQPDMELGTPFKVTHVLDKDSTKERDMK